MRGRAVVAAGAAALLLASCSSEGDDEPVIGETTEVTRGEAPAPPEPSPAGTGVVVVGGASSSFEVTACRLEADPSEPEGAQTLIAVEGSGTTVRGIAFTIQLQRFATGTEVKTFTDTVTYSDAGRILQAQRIEVSGQVTDLRDPDATSALIRPRPGGVSAAGLAGPPGGGGEETEGIIGLALDASC